MIETLPLAELVRLAPDFVMSLILLYVLVREQNAHTETRRVWYDYITRRQQQRPAADDSDQDK